MPQNILKTFSSTFKEQTDHWSFSHGRNTINLLFHFNISMIFEFKLNQKIYHRGLQRRFTRDRITFNQKSIVQKN